MFRLARSARQKVGPNENEDLMMIKAAIPATKAMEKLKRRRRTRKSGAKKLVSLKFIILRAYLFANFRATTFRLVFLCVFAVICRWSLKRLLT